MFRTIGTYLGIAVGSMIVGALLALLMMGKQGARQVTGEAREVVSTVAQAVVESVKENVRIEEKVDAGKKSTEAVKALVNAQMKPTKEFVYVNVPGKPEIQVCPPVGSDSVIPLSVSGVRLLNDLRAYRTVDLTGIDPTESETSAGVTVAEFVNNDTDVVNLYNELAIRHDELVDAVNAYLAKQAAKAKASK